MNHNTGVSYGIPPITVYRYSIKTNTAIPVSNKYREKLRIPVYRPTLKFRQSMPHSTVMLCTSTLSNKSKCYKTQIHLLL